MVVMMMMMIVETYQKLLCSSSTVSSLRTKLEIIISKNSLMLNQFSSPTVCLLQQWSRLSCMAADAIDFLGVGVGRKRGGTANDGNFHNSAMLFTGSCVNGGLSLMNYIVMLHTV